MIRDIDLSEVSDGRFYSDNDLVKVDCHDCKGCFSCCQGMGQSIILDPLDINRLMKGTGKTFEELMNVNIELTVDERVILPCLKMSPIKNGLETQFQVGSDRCTFLDDEGRCSIHEFRPGICRIFPLGRFWNEDGSYSYFNQIYECPNKTKSKIKVKKWIASKDVEKDREYQELWHGFVKKLKNLFKSESGTDEQVKAINMAVIDRLFVRTYDENSDFYEELKKRIEKLNVIF